MATLVLPQLLDIPDKLKPIITEFNNYDFFLIEGGRSSAKSNSVVRLCCYLGDYISALRVFFGREIQNTIEESIYQLVKDIITENSLAYSVMATKIDHRMNKTMFRFRGFRDKGKINIKGLEGVDILVIDEAQTLTAETLKILIPTIRKKGSKIFFMLNRTLKNDPVWEEMKDRPECLKIHIDYFENKHCPVKAMAEAEACRLRNKDDYEHIWLGKPKEKATNAVFSGVRSFIHPNNPLTDPEEPVKGFNYLVGGDLAKSVDHTWLSVFCLELKRFVALFMLESENRTSWNYQKELIHKVCKKYNDAEYVGDSTGVGDPITEDLQRAGVRIWYDVKQLGNKVKETAGLKFTSISKANIIERMKVCLELRMVPMPNCEEALTQTEQFEVTLLPGGNVRYAAPEGKDHLGNRMYHDDFVISAALALWGVRSEIYDKWEAPVIKSPTPIWDRVKKDMASENNSENSLHSEGNMITITHISNEEEFADPFEE